MLKQGLFGLKYCDVWILSLHLGRDWEDFRNIEVSIVNQDMAFKQCDIISRPHLAALTGSGHVFLFFYIIISLSLDIGIFYCINRNYPCAKVSIWSPDRVRLTALWLLCTYSFTTITRPQILWMGLPFDDTPIQRFSQGKNEYHTRAGVCVCSRESVAGCQLIDAIEGEETEAEVKICLFPWKWWYNGVKSDDKHESLPSCLTNRSSKWERTEHKRLMWSRGEFRGFRGVWHIYYCTI